MSNVRVYDVDFLIVGEQLSALEADMFMKYFAPGPPPTICLGKAMMGA